MTIIMVGTRGDQFGAAADSRVLVGGKPGKPTKKTFSLYGGKIVGGFEYNMSLAGRTMGKWIVFISRKLGCSVCLQKFVNLFVPEYETILNDTTIDQFRLTGRSSRLLLLSRNHNTGKGFEMGYLSFGFSKGKVQLNDNPGVIYFGSNEKKVSTGNTDAEIATEKFFDANVNRILDIEKLLRKSIKEGIDSAHDISIGDAPTVEIGL